MVATKLTLRLIEDHVSGVASLNACGRGFGREIIYGIITGK